MKKLFAVEFLECGVWTDVDYKETLEEALALASEIVDKHNNFGFNVREEWVRIVTPDNKYL